MGGNFGAWGEGENVGHVQWLRISQVLGNSNLLDLHKSSTGLVSPPKKQKNIYESTSLLSGKKPKAEGYPRITWQNRR